MILNSIVCFMKTSLNTNCESQIVINDNKNIIAEQQNCSHSQSSSSDYTLEDSQNVINSKTLKKDFKRRKKISWKKYLLIDNYQFKDDVREMYDKYVSESSHCEIKRIDDIDELYTMENINSRINIYDINEIFLDKIQDKNLIDVVSENLSHRSDDFFYNLNLADFNERLLSKEFIAISQILARDMYNVLKNSIDYMYPENEELKNILSMFEQFTNEKKSLSTYISICKLILNSEIYNTYLLEDNKVRLFSKLLHTTHKINDKILKIEPSLHKKIYKINLYLEKNLVSYCDILNYIISLINQLTDEPFRIMCIFGLQNLFKEDMKFNKHRFVKIIIYLYFFSKEKRYYFLNWHDYLIKTTSFKLYKGTLAHFTTKYVRLFKKENFYLYYHTYLAINTKDISLILSFYKKLQKNKSQLQLVKALILITNKVKCKIMGISNMNFR